MSRSIALFSACLLLAAVHAWGAKKATEPAPAPGLLVSAPLIYLPFHFGNAYFLSWPWPYHTISRPMLLAYFLVQYIFEHFTETAMEYKIPFDLVTNVTVLLILTFFVLCAMKGNKRHVGIAFIGFVIQSVIFISLDYKVPTSYAEQLSANADEANMQGHLAGHAALLIWLYIASLEVPWEPKQKAK